MEPNREPEGTWNSLLTRLLFLSAKVVDLDPCLSKKPLEEKPSQPYSARESLSEVQSLSSFQSESCDDNGKFQMPTLDAVADLKCCWLVFLMLYTDV